ncbi:hypothetical protein PFFCH_04431 [Plasmodium falciparum FCH/4]|uniref:Uncharacterized protein n=1 Tax=Plasmodium falciparum FCH/4 TaxID=1036724 RepID=A0A024VIQ9_PLAFA|nr:hypothetical protein PFFCH_04431 [Plasmodium falciparum FCH/4]
MGDYNKYYI